MLIDTTMKAEHRKWSDEDQSRIRRQLDALANSDLFSNATRLMAFLRYIVGAELAGTANRLGQMRIAQDVFGRGLDFDATIDSVVRVEAGRLRARLREYYATVGVQDDVRITLPKGRYGPSIELSPDAPPPAESQVQQVVRFLKTSDDVSIAYSVSGDGPVLVKAANWLSHLEYDYESPVWRHWWRDLSRRYTLIRYDERGCGLSDWDVRDFSLDAWVRDLEAVTDAVSIDRFALLGISQGAAVAVLYALLHPEKVSHLILYGGFAQGRLKREASARHIQEAQLLQQLVRIGWGQKDPTFRRVFASLFLPNGSPDQFDAFDSLQRYSTSPENAEKFIAAFNDIDVLEVLHKVRTPTLVIHSREEIEIPVSQAKLLASTIPRARLLLLDSDHHILGEDEQSWQVFLNEVDGFLTSEQSA